MPSRKRHSYQRRITGRYISANDAFTVPIALQGSMRLTQSSVHRRLSVLLLPLGWRVL